VPRVDPAARGAPGDCRPGRQGRTCSNGPDSQLGQDRCRRVDGGGSHHARPGVPRDQPSWA
jgi:hypothetical protein